MKADKKNRIHVVYSTDPNYNYEYNNEKTRHYPRKNKI